MLGHLSTGNQEVSNAHIHRINYLVGEYNVLVYMYQSEFWTKIGSGVSSIHASEKLITEKIEIMKNGDLTAMNNTFGYESSDVFKLLTLDLTSGNMDVYKGKLHDEKLIFCNTDSTSKPINIQGDSCSFKLIYNQLSPNENQVVIGRSKDDGKTWIPYIKSVYKRK